MKSPPTFSVDTHLFRELGELLVGRDSTALVELIKNAYDADATEVIVYGQDLLDLEAGFILVRDNGTGMTEKAFLEGFLRVAGRGKEKGNRRTTVFKRRYTGEKGVGRLAAHKLARILSVSSVPASPATRKPYAVEASIDWDRVEAHPTLDGVGDAISFQTRSLGRAKDQGTTIRLDRLRREWTERERQSFMLEVSNFQPPRILTDKLGPRVSPRRLLFDEPLVRDVEGDDPGFDVQLQGAFDVGEPFWAQYAEAAHWIIELKREKDKQVKAAIAPTKAGKKQWPAARSRRYTLPNEEAGRGPFFDARIYLNEGGWGQALSEESASATGVRVFLEGFRVLPYGEGADDWLGIDADYRTRSRKLDLDDVVDEEAIEDEGLVRPPGAQFVGGVFLTENRAEGLCMLVNREGFIPNAAFERLTKAVKNGIELSTRVRAAASLESRRERRQRRASRRTKANVPPPSPHATLISALSSASQTLEEVIDTPEGQTPSVAPHLARAQEELSAARDAAGELVSVDSMMRVLASVGTQMAGFIHELNTLVAMTTDLEALVARLRERGAPPTRADVAEVHSLLHDVRRYLERQASYLVDVVSVDARRRRSRQRLKDRFDAAARLITDVAARQDVSIENAIPDDLRSPPMFPAETVTVFANLLTNAVKAAGHDGRVRARGEKTNDGVNIRIENTGTAIDLDEAEIWFRPFESTTSAQVDPILGQGMGLGLPITRATIEEYGGTIRFVKPRGNFATAIELNLPL
jgi:signal transduction histidine kinase